MAISTGTKVQQYLGDSGLIISVSGKGYVPLSLVVDLIDSVAGGASFTKANADKVFTTYRDRIEEERIAAMPKPREISVPQGDNTEPVATEPYYLYRSPVETDGTPIYPEMGYVVVHIPVTVPDENRRRYALEALANASDDQRLIANDPSQPQAAGSVVQTPVEPVSPETAREVAESRAEATPQATVEVVDPSPSGSSSRTDTTKPAASTSDK